MSRLPFSEIFRQRKTDAARAENIKGTARISIYAVLVGLVSGIGAVGFRYLIALFHNLFFLGMLSFHYNSEEHITTPFGWLVIFVPVIGMLIVNFLTEKFAPEARGHGVPEVMNAVLENKGRIRPVVSVIKSLASAISIGSGGSVGREGPIVQIGASFGSTLGQLLKLPPRDVIVLVCAGVAGGIAGTFNAPIGGVAFAFELILPEFSIMTLMPLVVSATVATYVASIFLGTHPAFMIPVYSLHSPVEFIFYLALGLLAGGVAIAYIASLYACEDFFERIPGNVYIKGALGGLLLGLTGLLVYHIFGHYYIFGVGYSFITDTLQNKNITIGLVLAMIVLKIFANSLTLAAGGSGGIFAPSLFIGIAAGGFVGLTVNHLFPEYSAPASAYALVGMAAVVAGTTGASFTAIIMTFEMTRNYDIMVPLMLSVVVSHFVTRLFYRENIYSKKLARRGIYIQTDKMVSIFKLTSVEQTILKDFIYVTPRMSASDALTLMVANNIAILPVIDNGRMLGIVSYTDLFYAGDKEPVSRHIKQGNYTIDIKDNLLNAMERMEENNCALLVVMSDSRIAGITTRNRILKTYFSRRKMLMA